MKFEKFNLKHEVWKNKKTSSASVSGTTTASRWRPHRPAPWTWPERSRRRPSTAWGSLHPPACSLPQPAWRWCCVSTPPVRPVAIDPWFWLGHLGVTHQSQSSPLDDLGHRWRWCWPTPWPCRSRAGLRVWHSCKCPTKTSWRHICSTCRFHSVQPWPPCHRRQPGK